MGKGGAGRTWARDLAWVQPWTVYTLELSILSFSLQNEVVHWMISKIHPTWTIQTLLRRSLSSHAGLSPSLFPVYIHLISTAPSPRFSSLPLQPWPHFSASVPCLPQSFGNSHCHWNPRCLKMDMGLFLQFVYSFWLPQFCHKIKGIP